jgi:hypothetical protein
LFLGVSLESGSAGPLGRDGEPTRLQITFRSQGTGNREHLRDGWLFNPPPVPKGARSIFGKSLTIEAHNTAGAGRAVPRSLSSSMLRASFMVEGRMLSGG